MDTVEVEGLTLSYERAGQGPPLVLLHGYVGDGTSTWHPQLDELSDDYTVVAWDAPGAGRSSDPPENFGIAGYADCLAAFVRTLGFQRAHIGGLSFGGALAIALAHRHPAVPASLVLASAYAGWRGSLAPEDAEQRLQQALRLSERTPQEFTDALLPTMFTEHTQRESVERFGSALLEYHPAGFRAMSRAAAEDLHDALPGIRTATLLVFGDADVRAPLTIAEKLHVTIPGSTLVVLPGVGHVCSLEAPDAFNATVRRFLDDARTRTA